MDGDGDGRVSLAEYLDWMSYAFDARDGNRDGVLSADELPGGKGQAITRVQHRERLAATFKQAGRQSRWFPQRQRTGRAAAVVGAASQARRLLARGLRSMQRMKSSRLEAAPTTA